MFKLKSYLVILGFFLSAGLAGAQTSEDIVNKYIAKMGGREKWNAISSVVITGNQNLNGMDVPFTVSQKNPNSKRLEVNIQGQSFVQCYDGKTAWTINPFQGSGKAEVMPAAEGKQFADRSAGRPELIDAAAKGDKLVLSGKETIAGVNCYKVVKTTSSGAQTYYFDPASSYLTMMSTTMSSGPMQGKVIETYFADYKDEQGVMFPHTLDLKLDNQPFSKITYTIFKLNVPLDDGVFVMPAVTQK